MGNEVRKVRAVCGVALLTGEFRAVFAAHRYWKRRALEEGAGPDVLVGGAVAFLVEACLQRS